MDRTGIRDNRKRHGRSRMRLPVLWCVVFILLMECFSLVALLPDFAYAADGDLTIKVEYKSGKQATKVVSRDKIKKQKPTKDWTVIYKADDDSDPAEVTVKSITIKQLVELADLGSGIKSVRYGEFEIASGDFGGVYLVYPGQDGVPADDKYRLYYPGDYEKYDEGEYGDWSGLDTVTEFVADRSDTAPGTITISPSSATIKEGQTKLFKATIKWDPHYKANSSGINDKIKWSSSNTKVATVDGNGKVKALKKGTAKITAKSSYNSSVAATATVKVGPKETTTKATTTKATTRRSTTRYTYRHRYTPTRRYHYTRPTTRPTTTMSTNSSQTQSSSTTAAPAPGQMLVKEVTLTTSAPQTYEDPSDEFTEDETYEEGDESWDEETVSETGVEFGTGVGSAAVAAAACGVGAVGRIRRFRIDMGGPKEKAAGPAKEKKNPLKKLGKRK